MTELLPCPFCQSQVELEESIDYTYFITCRECDITMERFSSDALIAAWNTRPSPWLDIATCPKDGTTIDLWEPSGREPACYWDKNGKGWASEEIGFLYERISPTHWMPIPDGPKED